MAKSKSAKKQNQKAKKAQNVQEQGRNVSEKKEEIKDINGENVEGNNVNEEIKENNDVSEEIKESNDINEDIKENNDVNEEIKENNDVNEEVNNVNEKENKDDNEESKENVNVNEDNNNNADDIIDMNDNDKNEENDKNTEIDKTSGIDTKSEENVKNEENDKNTEIDKTSGIDIKSEENESEENVKSEENTQNDDNLKDSETVDTTTLNPSQLKPKPKKAVAFASPPPEIKQIHKEKEQDLIKSNPFHKIPPELAYLQKRNDPGPKPLPQSLPVKKNNGPQLGILRNRPIKELATLKLEALVSFDYPTVLLPVAANHVLVDTKYASLNSLDLSKINQWLAGRFGYKVGIGYEFSGIVLEVGSNWKNDFAEGDVVFGITDPLDKKGSFSTEIVVSPLRDILVRVTEDDLATLENTNVNLDFTERTKFALDDSETTDTNTEVGSVAKADGDSANTDGESSATSKPADSPEALPAMAKLCTFPSLYCRAKDVLSYLPPGLTSASILINGADTALGMTIVQALHQESYQFEKLNLILIIRDEKYTEMENFADHFMTTDDRFPTRITKISLVTHDMLRDPQRELVLRGDEKYMQKKPDFFASQVVEALFATQYYDDDLPVDEHNVLQYKLDLFVDIVGCKQYFQRNVNWKKLDEIKLPLAHHLAAPLAKIFKANTSEPFITKLLKPKRYGSSFVSCCRFTVKSPTYSVDDLITYESTSPSPWGSKWASSIMNTMTSYNYYECHSLVTKRSWVLEGYELLKRGTLKFKIDHYGDWRTDFKGKVNQLREDDGKMVVKVEDF